MKTAYYLYCLIKDRPVQQLPVTGIDNHHPVFFYYSHDIIAVMSEVSVDEFVGPESESNLQDISWIAPRAAFHEKIIELCSQGIPVLPARFGAIYSTLDVLDEFILKNYPEITSFFEKVAAKQEWAIKGFLNKNKLVKKLSNVALDRDSELSENLDPGAKYFYKKKIEAKTKLEINSQINEMLQTIVEKTGSKAADFYQRKVQSKEATGREEEMVANWAYLVPDRSLDEFLSNFKQCKLDYKNQGIELEVSGPWPPFSFCPVLEMAGES